MKDVSPSKEELLAQRKYKVFISSTFRDLKDLRTTLIETTLKEGHIPSGMELFPATPAAGVSVIEEEIGDSDIFVVLVGARLGSRVDGDADQLTFTQHEYEVATARGLPIVAFLLDESGYKAERDAIPSDSIEERKGEEELQAFREEVKKREDRRSRIVGFFSPDDPGKLAEDYGRALRACVLYIGVDGPRGGWLPGSLYDDMSDRIVLGTDLSDNIFFRTFADGLNEFGKLSRRTVLQKDLKQGVARYFWLRYFPRLHEKDVRSIFFESGSSIAYVSREFIGCIREQDWFYEEKMDERLRIRTNNLLTYLDFLFQRPPWRPLDVRLQPHGPFSADYGATYGTLSLAVHKSAPGRKDAIREGLDKATERRVNGLIAELAQDFSGHGLVLMTASGVDTREEATDAPYPGPHVGSYANMLLKRCLLSLSCPKVLFIDPAKWDYPFRFDRCHAVCDASFPWRHVVRQTPLMVALACETEARQEALAQHLFEHGFTDVDMQKVDRAETGPWSILAANPAFTECFAVR